MKPLFEEHILGATFHKDYVNMDYSFLDLAYEDRAHAKVGDSWLPTYTLRKTKCNDYDMNQLGLAKKKETFLWCSTRDASSVRATPSIKSDIYAGEPRITSDVPGAHFSGHVAYVQSYNNIFHLLASPNRSYEPLFSQREFCNLAYRAATLTEHYRITKSLDTSRGTRRRLLKALKSIILYVKSVISSCRLSSKHRSVRQEFRISLAMFTSLDIGELELDLAEGSHYPFYAFLPKDVTDYMEW